jgi:hypothetical protein
VDEMACITEKNLVLNFIAGIQETKEDYLQACLDMSARLVDLKHKLIDIFVRKNRRTISFFEVVAIRDIIDQLLFELGNWDYNTEMTCLIHNQLVEISSSVQNGYFQMALGFALTMVTPVMVPLDTLEIELDYLEEPPVLIC